MKRDVLFMCQFFYPEFVSSALLPYQTAKGLVEAGISVDVLCGYPKEYSDSEKTVPLNETVEGITIHRKKYLQLGRKNFLSRLINYFSFTLAIGINLFKCRKYKILIVYSNPPILPIIAVIAKKLFGCKIIFVSYDLYPEIAVNSGVLNESGIISKVMRFINKKLFKNVSRVVSLSHDMKRYIVENREISSEKVQVIPNWATESFQTTDTITNEQLREIRAEYRLIVSYFGNMGTAQDIDTLMKTINDEKIKQSKIAFLFAGHGNKKDKLKAFVQENQLSNCYVFDYLKGEDFTEALNISDLFVVTLENSISGLAVPSKTYSYYQAEKPVIAIMDKDTDIILEIEQYQAGIALENNASQELIRVLMKIQEDEETLLAMKKNVSKLHNEKYKKEYQIQKYIDLVGNILGE
ncbi:glycosyltransferase family 4 protein [Enterococcus songbeiensis]|uniref:glycosyltransferase family 4 protein n=1 Tax=Enterococcus songbeiensis TaxID=2559927 RepID=UPI0010F8DCCF|nr:glycosyltransferase family 4 protein [Enterococcus songbeiensis]